MWTFALPAPISSPRLTRSCEVQRRAPSIRTSHRIAHKSPRWGALGGGRVCRWSLQSLGEPTVSAREQCSSHLEVELASPRRLMCRAIVVALSAALIALAVTQASPAFAAGAGNKAASAMRTGVVRVVEVVGRPTPVTVRLDVPPGSYELTSVVTGNRSRVQITVNGRRVGAYELGGTSTLAIPVTLRDGPTTIGVRATSGSVTVGKVRLRAGTPGFTTQGAEILDPSGHPFVSHGVNRTGLNSSVNPRNMTRADFQTMRARGVDTVRLKLGEQLWVAGHCAYDPAYPAAVDRAVESITSLGMVAMLDLAWTTGSDPCGAPSLKQMPDATSVAFWEEVAARYKDNPLVSFGIYNEPWGVNYAVWRDGGVIAERPGPAAPVGPAKWKVVGMQDLYDTIRGTGARNLVYVSGTAWAHDLRGALSHGLDGYGIVYGAHIYNEGSDSLPSIVTLGIEPVIGIHPVVVTEFGSKRGATFNRRVIKWAESHGLGWQAFMWAPRSAGAFGLFDKWETVRPTGGGLPVLSALAAGRTTA